MGKHIIMSVKVFRTSNSIKLKDYVSIENQTIENVINQMNLFSPNMYSVFIPTPTVVSRKSSVSRVFSNILVAYFRYILIDPGEQNKSSHGLKGRKYFVIVFYCVIVMK